MSKSEEKPDCLRNLKSKIEQLVACSLWTTYCTLCTVYVLDIEVLGCKISTFLQLKAEQVFCLSYILLYPTLSWRTKQKRKACPRTVSRLSSILSLSYSSEGSPSPRSVQTSLTQNCLNLTMPGFPNNLLPDSRGDLGFKKSIGQVLAWKSGLKVSLPLLGPPALC
jgi:hypothetical protein